MHPIAFLALFHTNAAVAQQPTAPPTPEQVEAATGLQVVSTSAATGKPVGPSTAMFQQPAACPGEDGAREVDATADPALLEALSAARTAQDEASLPVEVRGMQAWLFRLEADGAQLWLQVTELAAHELPLPTLYAHGLLQRCPAHKAFELRFEHAGRHWHIEGPCALSSKRAVAFARTLEAQLQPTWLVASPCGGMSPLDAAFMQSAGIAAEQVVEAVGGLCSQD